MADCGWLLPIKRADHVGGCIVVGRRRHRLGVSEAMVVPGTPEWASVGTILVASVLLVVTASGWEGRGPGVFLLILSMFSLTRMVVRTVRSRRPEARSGSDGK